MTPPRCAPQVASSAVARRAREIMQQRSEPPQEVVCYGVGDIFVDVGLCVSLASCSQVTLLICCLVTLVATTPSVTAGISK